MPRTPFKTGPAEASVFRQAFMTWPVESSVFRQAFITAAPVAPETGTPFFVQIFTARMLDYECAVFIWVIYQLLYIILLTRDGTKRALGSIPYSVFAGLVA